MIGAHCQKQMVLHIPLKKVPFAITHQRSGIAETLYNTAWLIQHGCALTSEYHHRYGKIHTCAKTLFEAKKLFHRKTELAINCHIQANNFARAMPEEFKYDDSIDTFTAYKMYIASKPWAKDNYLRKPERKPDWI